MDRSGRESWTGTRRQTYGRYCSTPSSTIEDGHTCEFIPALESYLRDEFSLCKMPSLTMPGSLGPVWYWYSLSIAEQHKNTSCRAAGPGASARAHQRPATAFLKPPLAHDRLRRTGQGPSAFIYPSIGLLFLSRCRRPSPWAFLALNVSCRNLRRVLRSMIRCRIPSLRPRGRRRTRHAVGHGVKSS